MALYQHQRHDESENLENYSPRELQPRDSSDKQLSKEVLNSPNSLFPKIFNSFLTKKELNEVMLLKKPLINPLGKLKSLKLLQFDLATLDTRDLYDYLGTESYQDMPQILTYPSELQSRLLFYLSDIVDDICRAE